MTDTAFEDVVYQRHGPVAVITIDRPQSLNALRFQTSRELSSALARALAAASSASCRNASCVRSQPRPASASRPPNAARRMAREESADVRREELMTAQRSRQNGPGEACEPTPTSWPARGSSLASRAAAQRWASTADT